MGTIEGQGFSAFRADRARYPRHAWLTQRSLWAVAAFRFGQEALGRGPVWRIAHRLIDLASQVTTNIEIPARASIGPGLRIYHAGPVVIHEKTVIGSHCTLNVGTVIGAARDDDVPVIGDRLTTGAHSHLLGAISVGDDVSVGALSIVTKDVPAGALVAGNPARVLRVHGVRVTTNCGTAGSATEAATGPAPPVRD
jgi:serine O-acetyltransferase